MSDQFFFRYGNFELHVHPREAPHGRFRAHLRIVHIPHEAGGDQIVDLGDIPDFDTAGEAADHARVIGQQWVDQHGGPRSRE